MLSPRQERYFGEAGMSGGIIEPQTNALVNDRTKMKECRSLGCPPGRRCVWSTPITRVRWAEMIEEATLR